MAISSPGIGSGLDVNGIVTQLVALEKQPLVALQRRETEFTAQLSAYGSLKGAISSLQGTVQGLSTLASFQKFTANSGDATIFTATATSASSAGSHTVDVQMLAQTHKIRSNNFTTLDSVVGTGKLTFQFGTYDSGGNTFTLNPDKAAKSVTITSSNQTLAGLRDAVNAANLGITASIVNDGTGYKLVFASNDAGAKNGIKVTVADDDTTNTDTSGLSQLAYDPTAVVGSGKNLVETAAARNATVVIDGITVSKTSNTITDALDGVTLNLLKSGAGATTLNVAQDTGAVQKAAQSFVDSYNSLNKTLNGLTAYDASTKTAGVLQGDSTALSVGTALRNTLSRTVTLSDGQKATLNTIGISFTKEGTLALDSTKFQNALKTQPDLIGRLFAAAGTASDSLVGYLGSSANSKPGNYTLNISQLAAQGTLTGNAIAGLTITAGSNDSFALTLDGVSATVTLNAGVYASADALAAEVQSQINGLAAFSGAGSKVTVSAAAGMLSIQSARYGSTSAASVGAGAGAINLFGAAPVSVGGVNVAGTYQGVAGTASGRTLTGAAGTGAAGLQYEVRGGALGARGSVTFAQGYAVQLNQVLQSFLDSKGLITSRTDGINATIKDLQAREDRVNQRAADAEKRYRAQFTRLDVALSSMNATSSYLQQQLTALSNLNTSISQNK